MKTVVAVLASFALAASVRAGTQTFDFKDPEGVNSVGFKLDGPLAAINGTASGVTGQITTDPENFADAKGKITVDGNTLMLPNPAMQQDLQGEGWFDVNKNSEICFEFKKISDVKKDGATSTADVTGIFTLKGISKEITVPMKITYLPGKLSDRTAGKMEGDLLVIRSNFSIKRSDYDIGEKLESVAEKIDVSLSIAGMAPKGP